MLKGREIKNLSDAVDKTTVYLDNFRRKKLHIPGSFFLMVHKILLRHDTQNAGKYRTALHSLDIKGKTFSPPKAQFVRGHIVDLIEFINNKHKWGPKYRKHILNKADNIIVFGDKERRMIYKIFIAWYIHHKFVIIHPFVDGNGRMARILMCLVLRYEALSEISFPPLLNNIINKSKSEYLDSLNAADKGNYLVGVNYMFKILKSAYIGTNKRM